jgi:predicted ribosome quality control (RQC) complex YloA/Tae2 family protein
VSFAENRHRQILPGCNYEPPETAFVPVKETVIYPLKIESLKEISENNKDAFNSMNPLFESIYYDYIFARNNETEKQKAIKKIQSQISKKQKKINKLEIELQNASKEDSFKQIAELLKANFSKLKSGMESIILQDYYADGFPEIEIALDKTKHPKQNVEFYFKKFRKARDGKVRIAEQLAKTHDEIDELEKKIFEIEETGIYLATEDRKNAKHKKVQHLKRLKINDDWEILVGRTSKENDQLTTKIAKPQDWWFHTRIFRGTHIILRNFNKKDLPDNLKMICCRLAAYYSKAKTSSNVPVDFTQIKYVRKPRGSAPGFVTYKNQNTIYVDPIDFREAGKKLKDEYPILNTE